MSFTQAKHTHTHTHHLLVGEHPAGLSMLRRSIVTDYRNGLVQNRPRSLQSQLGQGEAAIGHARIHQLLQPCRLVVLSVCVCDIINCYDERCYDGRLSYVV